MSLILYLFIFESIGTSELILIGIIALIFLGPRKLPQIARTIGKTMADFRNTTNEFKSTWEREVNFEDEEKALRTGVLDEGPVARVNSIPGNEEKQVAAPEIRQIDKESFEKLANEQNETVDAATDPEEPEIETLSDKRNWL